MYDIWVSIKDLGPLPIIGAVIIVALFVKALMGNGKGGGNSNNSSNS